jgi:hypothetical protein
MAYVNDRECDAAGLDPKVVERLARRIEKCAKECQALGITIFGGAHSGDLRADEANRGARRVNERQLILAHMEGAWDGGDGGSNQDENGLQRGEGI